VKSRCCDNYRARKHPTASPRTPNVVNPAVPRSANTNEFSAGSNSSKIPLRQEEFATISQNISITFQRDPNQLTPSPYFGFSKQLLDRILDYTLGNA
jgi:hypothetical protein